MANGAWKVYRFSPGVHEADTWTQDGQGWTTCCFNRKPDLRTAARAHGGIEDPEKGGHVFRTTAPAREAAKLLGCDFQVPDNLAHRQTRLTPNKHGFLTAEIAREKDDADLPGWLNKGSRWIRGFSQRVESEEEEVRGFEMVRALVTPEGEPAGLLIRQKDNKWVRQGLGPAKMVLQSTGMKKTEAEEQIGDAIREPFETVNFPFQAAWLSGRRCNIDAAQFKVPSEEGEHPHWDMVFDHTFASLTEPIKKNPWFADNGIHSGGDYGRAWLACLIKCPLRAVADPCHGGRGELGQVDLVRGHPGIPVSRRGVVSVNEALTRQDSFNGELEGALLCVVEEISLADNRKALARLKEWTTARVLADPSDENGPVPRPVFGTFLYVREPTGPHPCTGRRQPHRRLLGGQAGRTRSPSWNSWRNWRWKRRPCCTRSATGRCRAITDRLRLPLVNTEDKDDLAEQNSPLSAFLKECCQVRVGEYIPKDDMRLRLRCVVY